MAIVYLEPADLSASQVARILAFLNGAQSAAEIAAGVEFPGELDIGVKLAERLLVARAEHGGLFASLEQVRAVPLIGPERFTELCAAVLKLDPRHWVGQLGQFLDQQEHIAARAVQLGAQLAALEQLTGSVALLELRASPQPAWLGQGLWIEAELRDASGQPLANRELTLETNLGLLESSFGFVLQRAPALRVRTGADGVARLQLQFQPLEPLTRDQQNALARSLDGLDASAETPRAVRNDFLKLAALYDDEHEVHLRRAIDIYARHYKSAVFDRLNPDDAEYAWPLESAVVRAHYHPVAGSAGVATSAVLPVAWKNWLGAWFEYLRQYLEQGRALQAALAAAKRRGASGYRLVADLVGQAHTFVAGQKGLAAEWASQRLVGGAVREFLADGLEGVDESTRAMLFPSLELAADQLRVGNAGALALVDNTRAELQGNIEQIAKIDTGMLAEIANARQDVLANAARVNEDIAAFDLRRDAVDEKLKGFDRDYTSFSSQRAGFERDYADFSSKQSAFSRDYAQFHSDYGNFTGSYAQFNNNLAGFNSSYASFTSNYATFSNNYSTFNQNLATFNSSYSAFNTHYADFSANYGKFSTDNGSFSSRYGQFGVDYGKFQTDIAGFNRDRSSISTEIGGLRTQVNGVAQANTSLQQEVGQLKTGLGNVQGDVSSVRNEMAAVKLDVAAVKADVSGVKGDVTGMRTELNGVKTEVSSVKTDLSTVRSDLGSVRLDVTGINQKITAGNLNLPGGTITRPRGPGG